jgi:hypothetical protein
MPRITLDLGDAAELAEMLTFLADWMAEARSRSWTAASPPTPATPTRYAPTFTGSYSCSASATGARSSASRHHDHQYLPGTPT